MAGHPELPFIFGIAIPLLNADEEKLPTNEEAEQLNKIEDSLVETFEKELGVHNVLIITTNGMREFVFYTKEWKPEQYENTVKEIAKKHPEHKLQFMMQEDRKWDAVTSLLP
jgi:CRISPR/Cas system CSM-associated protein Csm2 small subunit